MSRNEASNEAKKIDLLPCPLCGSTNITSNEWAVDGEHAEQFGADDFGEIWAYECNDCLAAAPIQSWQKRWHDGEPPLDTQVLLTYRHPKGHEAGPIITTRTTDIESQPTIRWTHIPAHDAAHDAAETLARRETPDLFEDTGAVSWV